MDPRRKIEVLYADVLVEVGELLDRTEALRTSLPLAATEAAGRLETQTNALLQASERLRAGLGDVLAQVAVSAELASRSAADGARIELRTAVIQAVRETLLPEASSAGQIVDRAARSFAKESTAALSELRRERTTWIEVVAFGACSAIAGTLFTVLSLYFLGLINSNDVSLADIPSITASKCPAPPAPERRLQR
jgi:hypothetical protein